MATTIQISDGVKKSLEKMRIFDRETYNEVIESMIEDQLEINEKTKKELAERRTSKEVFTLKDVERELGL